MYSKIIYSSLFSLAALVPYISAHGLILAATGDLGGQGQGLAVDTNIPRTGKTRNPFQLDTTIFKNQKNVQNAQGCGQTLLSGQVDIASGVQAAVTSGLPQVSAGGQLTMTLHQINADGAGPYTCMIDMTGTGQSFQQLVVTSNVPGNRGNRIAGSLTDFSLVAAMPANMQCVGASGTATGICMVRCQNPAAAGPFGGCVPVQQAQPGTNGTAIAAPSAATAIPPAPAAAAASSAALAPAAVPAVAPAVAVAPAASPASVQITNKVIRSLYRRDEDEDEEEEDNALFHGVDEDVVPI